MDVAKPALGAAGNVADPELDQGEGKRREKKDEGKEQAEQQDSAAVKARSAQVMPSRYLIFQFVGTVMISLAWALAISGVEESLDSGSGSQGPLTTLLTSLLRMRAPAIVVPVLFLAFSGSLNTPGTHPLKRNVCLLAVYALLGTPFVLLPFLLPEPEPCSAPGTSNEQHNPAGGSSADSVPGEEASQLWKWTSCFGPVLLVGIISAAKLYRARNKMGPVAAPLSAPIEAPIAAPKGAPKAAPKHLRSRLRSRLR